MVPDSFNGYFTAAASAAGALIGLLFVAQLAVGIGLIARLHNTSLVSGIAWITIV